MNRFQFEKILDECLIRLESGEPLNQILADHPSEKNRLEPLLTAAQAGFLQPPPKPSTQVLEEGKNQLLEKADRMRGDNLFLNNGTKSAFSRFTGRWKIMIGNLVFGKENVNMKLVPRLALYVLITVMMAGFFTVNASASSLPGESLYGVKLGWEQVRLLFAFDDDSRSDLEFEFEQERLEEVESLLAAGREEDVEFIGEVESMGETWVVSGISVVVDATTEVKGSFEIGSLVKVEALTLSDGSLLALEIYTPDGDMPSDSDDVMDDDSDDDLDDDFDDDLDDDSDDDLDDDSDDDLDDDSGDDLDDDSDDDLDDDSGDDLDDDSDDDLDDDSDDDLEDDSDDDLEDDSDDDLEDDSDDDLEDDSHSDDDDGEDD